MKFVFHCISTSLPLQGKFAVDILGDLRYTDEVITHHGKEVFTTITTALLVGVGGGLGALLRYLIELIPFHTTFPMATFLINMGGSFIMGLFVGAAERHMASDRTMTVLRVGFCGGFTTLSTFGVETIALFENDQHMTAYAYMLATFVTCFVGIWIGRMIVRSM